MFRLIIKRYYFLLLFGNLISSNIHSNKIKKQTNKMANIDICGSKHIYFIIRTPFIGLQYKRFRYTMFVDNTGKQK